MRLALFLLLLFSLGSQGAALGLPERGSAEDVALTILYDNTSVSDSVIADHGFSCLVESGDRSILFVRRARELMRRDVYLVLGGFHLAAAEPARVQAIAGDLRKLTKRVGPCHCTGEKAREMFKDVFKEDYVDIKAGLRLKIADGTV
jgi:metal-dependent hydrolase (beta-lactamase superfamily II)